MATHQQAEQRAANGFLRGRSFGFGSADTSTAADGALGGIYDLQFLFSHAKPPDLHSLQSDGRQRAALDDRFIGF